MVEDWMTRLSRESGGRQSSALSATTVNRCFVCLRKIHRDGVRRGELRLNRVEGVDLMKQPRCQNNVPTKLSEVAKRMRANPPAPFRDDEDREPSLPRKEEEVYEYRDDAGKLVATHLRRYDTDGNRLMPWTDAEGRKRRPRPRLRMP